MLTLLSAVLCVPMLVWSCQVHGSVCQVGWSGCVPWEVCPPQHFQSGQEEHDALGCVGRWVTRGRSSEMFRDLGDHLDFTRRAKAGTLSLSSRGKKVPLMVLLLLVPCLLGFRLNMVWCMVSICHLGYILLRRLMFLLLVLLLSGLFGPVRCLWPTLRWPAISWMVRLVLTRLFILSGLGSAFCAGIWRMGLMRFPYHSYV